MDSNTARTIARPVQSQPSPVDYVSEKLDRPADEDLGWLAELEADGYLVRSPGWG